MCHAANCPLEGSYLPLQSSYLPIMSNFADNLSRSRSGHRPEGLPQPNTKFPSPCTATVLRILQCRTENILSTLGDERPRLRLFFQLSL